MYKKIEDYGVIGNQRTAALISKNGSIDFCCLPSFDAPTVFAAMLDDKKGGKWWLRPKKKYTVERKYIPKTNILETNYKTKWGKAKVIDFMPVGKNVLVRMVECTEGEISFLNECTPQFDYAQSEAAIEETGKKTIYSGKNQTLVLRGNEKEFILRGGERKVCVLSYGEEELFNAQRALERTERYWKKEISQISYDGEYKEAVERSILTLLMLVYKPTGGIVAAPTTSLPELIGGNRNWDYRYVWIRDSTLTIQALVAFGVVDIASDLLQWLVKAAAEAEEEIQIMYGVRHEANLEEKELDHLSGYEDSKPVRIGNGAYNHLQWDVWGSAIHVIWLYYELGGTITKSLWTQVEELVTSIMTHWKYKDEGIWEVRGGKQHFVHSKVMCWSGIDQAIKLAEELDKKIPEEWVVSRDYIKKDIIKKGYSEKLKSFVQSYNSKNIDASSLLFPLFNFIEPNDEKMIGTLEAIRKKLVNKGMVKRYDSKLIEPDLSDEGIFNICTFWYSEVLAKACKKAEAKKIFEGMIKKSNDLLLFSEEYDQEKKRYLGNYPQAFTHIGLLRAAMALQDKE